MSDPYLDEMIADWRNQFRGHRPECRTIMSSGVKIPPRDLLYMLSWAKPGTSTCRIDYIIVPRSGVLHVQGDLGFASYCWWGERNLDLAFLAGCQFDYFVGKCESSEKGRRPVGWDDQRALIMLRQYWADLEPPDKMTLADAEASLARSSGAAEWDRHVWDMYQDGLDPEDCSLLARIGEVPDFHVVAHWVGLKMAHEQLGASV